MKNVMKIESSGLVSRGQKSTLFQCLLSSLIFSVIFGRSSEAAPEVFTNSFLVKLTGNHGHERANLIAKRNGFENLGKVRNFFLVK